MTADVLRLLAENLPDRRVRSVTPLGSGLDNVAYEVDGELVVRIGAAAEHEKALLDALAAWSTLPVPEPVFADGTALAYRKVPGTPLFERLDRRSPDLAEVLGGFLRRLHDAPLADLVERDDTPPAEWLAEARAGYREIEPLLPEPGPVPAFLAAEPPPPAEHLVFCHNDLGAEHILVDDTGAVTGVIDWTDAAVADPAVDFARLYRDLGPEVVAEVVRHYGRPVDLGRVAWYARCVLLEDVAFGGRHRANALANLARTFRG